MGNYSSIDDVLAGAKTSTHPETPESVDNSEAEIYNEEDKGAEEVEDASFNSGDEEGDIDDDNIETVPEKIKEVDDYGNEVSPKKMYTEEEVNDRINQTVRERLARSERNIQPTQAQERQAAQAGFEYDPADGGNWQSQLKNFVVQTMVEEQQQNQRSAQTAKEQQMHNEFADRVQSGMTKFPDFLAVVSSANFTDAMTLATRSMKDPAAFMYAASKRAPAELQRIAQITDPYAQVSEIGKLEERIKQTKASTKTPRPVSRTHEDASIRHKSEKEPTIEDLIASDSRRRLKIMNNRKS